MKTFPRQRAPLRGPTSVLDFLHRDEGAAGLLPSAQRLLGLRQDLLALMPVTLRDHCEVSGFDEEIVVLRVTSAGAAAKLRQTLPRLRDGLIDRGWKVNAIRMRVQPRKSPVASTTWRAPTLATIPTAGVDSFAALNRSLDDSPLKAAVERLIRRRAQRAG